MSCASLGPSLTARSLPKRARAVSAPPGPGRALPVTFKGSTNTVQALGNKPDADGIGELQNDWNRYCQVAG